jgi:hypothetical protein
MPVTENLLAIINYLWCRVCSSIYSADLSLVNLGTNIVADLIIRITDQVADIINRITDQVTNIVAVPFPAMINLFPALILST